MTPINSNLVRHSGNIITIDTEFMRPGLVASHLLVNNGRALFIDVGVSKTVPVLLQALVALGIARDAVEAIIITHVHLDHAGGAGRLMSELPNAKLLVHPSAAKHMLDPSKLSASATRVYGEEQMRSVFGAIEPVEKARLLIVNDNEKIEIAGREMVFMDTPGHAYHHNCIYDKSTNSVFTGDAFGLSYREFDIAGQAYMMPTTTPTQFNPAAYHKTIERILALNPSRLFLTHFGCIQPVAELATQLHKKIDQYVDSTLSCMHAENRYECLHGKLAVLLVDTLVNAGSKLSADSILALFAMDLDLNTQGLLYWLDKELSKQEGG